MLAIQNTCGASCCRDGAEGDAAFASVAANHNYNSNNGPGPWLIATLDQFDDARKINYGAGLWDVNPCPRTNNLDPTNPRTCDPSTCTSAPPYPSDDWGCYRCDEVARVAYISAKCSDDISDHLQLSVTDTVQRGETDAYAACYYLVDAYVHLASLSGVGVGASLPPPPPHEAVSAPPPPPSALSLSPPPPASLPIVAPSPGGVPDDACAVDMDTRSLCSRGMKTYQVSTCCHGHMCMPWQLLDWPYCADMLHAPRAASGPSCLSSDPAVHRL